MNIINKIFRKTSKPIAIKADDTKLTTVKDLLADDNINWVLNEIEKNKPDIEDIIILYKNKDETFHWRLTEHTPISTIIYMLECAKLDQLNDSE